MYTIYSIYTANLIHGKLVSAFENGGGANKRRSGKKKVYTLVNCMCVCVSVVVVVLGGGGDVGIKK